MPLVNATGISHWTPDGLPDLSGKLYIITGGNSGIGLEAAKILAERNADVVIAARNPTKGANAVTQIDQLGSGKAQMLKLDLADMASIRAAAEEAKTRFGSVAALINNAGIMQTPEQKTADGFEMQIGTNHLGHFLWTALMIGQVDPEDGRVVTLSSIAHRLGKVNLDDLMFEKARYDATQSYGQSKLANMLFGQELHRRLQASGSKIKSIVCHPGYSATELQSTGPTGLMNAIYKLTNALMAQPAKLGSYPTVLSAADPAVVSGAYYGPTAMWYTRGPVGDCDVEKRGLDEATAKGLWDLSEELVGEKLTV